MLKPLFGNIDIIDNCFIDYERSQNKKLKTKNKKINVKCVFEIYFSISGNLAFKQWSRMSYLNTSIPTLLQISTVRSELAPITSCIDSLKFYRYNCNGIVQHLILIS